MINLPVLIVPIVVGATAQFLKKFFPGNKHSGLTLQGISIPRYGGMPSAHTAFVFSLLTTILLTDGLYSAAAAIAVASTIFIIDDALRMRIFLEKHGQALNKLIQKLPSDEQASFPQLESRLGHKPTEVFAGAVLGVVMTWFLLLFIV